ncbi:hypothetical protein G7Y89_g1728 [Cudoniella acicularis]|uniref:Uncharacterized protein n=1 Tax=Cudoniella acicularis TaxID=354080 RepID=A0A8H4RUM8_9HELO|nr:hypothetical protein G7Y89_g1728 [Cudoniella acicularis]
MQLQVTPTMGFSRSHLTVAAGLFRPHDGAGSYFRLSRVAQCGADNSCESVDGTGDLLPFKVFPPLNNYRQCPSQCTSLLTPGQTLIYESSTANDAWGAVTSTVPTSTTATSGPMIIYGMHVNGFNVIAAVTTHSSSLSASTSSPSIASNIPRGSSSLPRDAVAGISVGITLAVILVAAGAWLFSHLRKKRGKRAYKLALTSQTLDTNPNAPAPCEINDRPISVHGVYELPTVPEGPGKTV